jgi:hypothetical protein
LLFPDLPHQLEAFNPKLASYITSTPNIPHDIVTYITVPPNDYDSQDRKYKLPLLAVEMVETEADCVMNAMMKESPNGSSYFLTMFDMLKPPVLLPILVGYFARCNLKLCRTKYESVLHAVFSSPHYLQLLIQHSEYEPIAKCLNYYLCV